MSFSIEILTPAQVDVVYIEVNADVRYWEDAEVNGKEDADGTLIPCRKGDDWCPVITMSDGKVVGWPSGTLAKVHYKVCDAGEYWLLDADKKRIAKWGDCYVPNDILCIGSNGYGDYIILKINADGFIEGWQQPMINRDEWEPV